jgi:hypothetical protein
MAAKLVTKKLNFMPLSAAGSPPCAAGLLPPAPVVAGGAASPALPPPLLGVVPLACAGLVLAALPAAAVAVELDVPGFGLPVSGVVTLALFPASALVLGLGVSEPVPACC